MRDEMFFAARVAELCMRGDRVDAVLLAKEHLRHARDVTVSIDGASVVVETAHFRGIHRWAVDPDGALHIDRGGEYRCTVEDLDLTLSTATMNPRALELARAEIDARREPEGWASRPSAGGSPGRDGDFARSGLLAQIRRRFTGVES